MDRDSCYVFTVRIMSSWVIDEDEVAVVFSLP